MAVSGMKKLSAATLRDEADSLLYELQRLRCVELQTRTELPRQERNTDLPAAIGQAADAIDFLSGYRVKTRGLFVSPAEKEWDAAMPAGRELAEKAQTLSRQLSCLQSRQNGIKNRREGLLPWKEYTGSLPESRTRYTRTVCGLLPMAADRNALEQALAEYACVVEEVYQTPPADPEILAKRGKKNRIENRALAVTIWKEDADAVLSVLNTYGFLPVPHTVTEEEGGAAGVLASLDREEEALAGEMTELKTQAEKLAEDLPLLEEYYDRLTTMEAREEAADKLAYTRQTAVLTGWVPVNMADKVAALLDKRGDAWSLTDPEPEDDVPVLLANNAMASQFEPVVSLYSLPAYGTFDPTFIMSFFYILIFGLMFADVGYGILLTAACLIGNRLMKPEGSLGKFMNMFAMCGVSMIVMGVLFGGYLGDLPQAIAQNFGGRTEALDLALWFNPMNDPMTFLVVSIAIGAVHLFAGLAVQFYILWKSGDKVAAVCDAGSWMLIFLGAGIAFLQMHIGLAVVGIGVLMLICTQGRHEKNPIMKVLKGFMGLYGIVNYVSDLLSYSRILSLGLASAVIASVFNIIGTMAGPSVIGVLLLIVVGTIGHAMNLAINLLGSFVHTSRLQYIEFFGKFYEDGGRPFVPLTPRSKYVRFR